MIFICVITFLALLLVWANKVDKALHEKDEYKYYNKFLNLTIIIKNGR